jgi:hypothetical protein
MKTHYRSFLGLIGALAIAGSAYAQVPSTNDTTTTDGQANTGMGTGALGGPTPVNLTGYDNTASGSGALGSNTSGNFNTASGYGALYSNTGGSNNTAAGINALTNNTTGNYNTASGAAALYHNTTGNSNAASGYWTLFYNTTGADNTASGQGALFSNTTGSANTASGYEALYANTIGVQNTASGELALFHNKRGDFNTGVGYGALDKNTSGKYNVAVGWEAGFALTTGSNNIDIDNQGEAGDSDTIRIGTQGTQTNTSIAGIFNNTSVSGLPVVVDSTGQLGAQAPSAERFKTAIVAMGSTSAKLQQLRPVTFHYKADPQGTLRYGLVAEEVARVYPELVVRDNKGRIYGVRYDELAPMLLNEVQKKNAAQDAEIRDLKQQVAELNDLKQELHAALLKLRATDEFVAQR